MFWERRRAVGMLNFQGAGQNRGHLNPRKKEIMSVLMNRKSCNQILKGHVDWRTQYSFWDRIEKKVEQDGRNSEHGNNDIV